MENLEHRSLDLLKRYDLTEKKFLLGVSGGKDSMALLFVFHTLRRILKFSFSVGFVHHGSHHNQDHRQKTYELVKKVCDKLQIPFFSNYEEGSFSLKPSDSCS